MIFFHTVWKYLLVSSPFLIFGLFFSGLIHALVPESKIKKIMGQKGFWPVVKAAVIGVPLPLCSCAVIPTAVSLKKNGASNAATSSFLISTPETGIDSIALTYALLDLPMTIIRPICAFLTALVAGLFQMLFNEKDLKVKNENVVTSCCDENKVEKKFFKKIFSGIKYAFNDLLDDMAPWLLIGIIASALIEYFLPPDIFSNLNGPLGRFFIILISIPMYICASASTPIAAAMVLKGMSPGSALLILLAGPSTNISNILVLQKFIGVRGVMLNIFTIILISFSFSYLVDFLYSYYSWPLSFKMGIPHLDEYNSFPYQFIGVITTLLIIRGVIREKFLKGDHA